MHDLPPTGETAGAETAGNGDTRAVSQWPGHAEQNIN